MANISSNIQAYTYTPHNTFKSISFAFGYLLDLDAFTDRLGSIPSFLPIFHRQLEMYDRPQPKTMGKRKSMIRMKKKNLIDFQMGNDETMEDRILCAHI